MLCSPFFDLKNFVIHQFDSISKPTRGSPDILGKPTKLLASFSSILILLESFEGPILKKNEETLPSF